MVTCRERAGLLASFVVSNCEFVTVPLVFWVMSGTLCIPLHPYLLCSLCLVACLFYGGLVVMSFILYISKTNLLSEMNAKLEIAT